MSRTFTRQRDPILYAVGPTPRCRRDLKVCGLMAAHSAASSRARRRSSSSIYEDWARTVVPPFTPRTQATSASVIGTDKRAHMSWRDLGRLPRRGYGGPSASGGRYCPSRRLKHPGTRPTVSTVSGYKPNISFVERNALQGIFQELSPRNRGVRISAHLRLLTARAHGRRLQKHAGFTPV
jgi:hypothetical protein